MYGLVICCFAAARDGLDKTIQAAVDGSCIPGIFPLISIPTIVGCIGAAMIIVSAVATPIAKSQRMREIWFYVMSSGVMLKVVVMERRVLAVEEQEIFLGYLARTKRESVKWVDYDGKILKCVIVIFDACNSLNCMLLYTI